MKRLTASDRSSLIKLAASLPAGSSERKLVLSKLNKKAYGLTTKIVYEDHLTDMSTGEMRKFLHENSLKDLYPNESDETLQLVAGQLEKCIKNLEAAADVIYEQTMDLESKFLRFSESHNKAVKRIRNYFLKTTGSPAWPNASNIEAKEKQLEQFILNYTRVIDQAFDIYRYAHKFFND